MITIDINNQQRKPLLGGALINSTEILNTVDKKIEALKEELGSGIPSVDAPVITELTGQETFTIKDSEGNYRTVSINQIATSSEDVCVDFSKQFNFDFN